MEADSLFQTRWGLEVERHELSAAIDHLVEAGKLVREEGALRLDQVVAADLARRVRTSKQIEAEAFQDWERRVQRDIAPSLGTLQVGELQQDLITWIQQIVLDQGVAAAVMLYREREQFKQRVEEIEAFGFEHLPERDPSIMMVRAPALRAFFDEMTDSQRAYIDHMASTSYLMSIFSLDSTALPKIKKLATGQRLYIDTNVIYSLLGLHGVGHRLAAQRMLELSRSLGFSPCVTPWTVSEMHESARAVREKFMQARPSPDFPGLRPSPDSDGHEVLMRELRRLERDRGISPKEFLAYQKETKSLLEDLRIAVIDDGCSAIDAQPDRVSDEIARLERVRQGDPKSLPVQEHDVKHRMLIEELRAGRVSSFADAGHVMLTHDHGLVEYADIGRGDDELPFAVGFRRWRRIIRNLKPRTGDYEKSVEAMIATHSLAGIDVSPSEAIQAIIRISAFEDLSPTTATRAMFDAAIGTENDASADIDEAVVDPREMAALRVQVLSYQQRLIAEQGAHAETKVAAAAELVAERRARTEAEDRAERASERASPRRTSEIEELGYRLGEQEQLVRHQQQIFRWLIACFIALAGIAVLAIPLATGWITHGRLLVANVCGGGAIEVGAFAWLYGKKRASTVVTGLGVILGIVVAVQTFIG
jgi:hypothetical protein